MAMKTISKPYKGVNDAGGTVWSVEVTSGDRVLVVDLSTIVYGKKLATKIKKQGELWTLTSHEEEQVWELYKAKRNELKKQRMQSAHVTAPGQGEAVSVGCGGDSAVNAGAVADASFTTKSKKQKGKGSAEERAITAALFGAVLPARPPAVYAWCGEGIGAAVVAAASSVPAAPPRDSTPKLEYRPDMPLVQQPVLTSDVTPATPPEQKSISSTNGSSGVGARDEAGDSDNATITVSTPYCDGSGAWFADVIVKGVRSPYPLDFMSGPVSRQRAKQGKEWTLTDWMREQVLGLYRRDRAAAKKARLAEAKQRAEEEAAKAQKQRTKAERKAAAWAAREAAERRTEEAAMRAAGGGHGATPVAEPSASLGFGVAASRASELENGDTSTDDGHDIGNDDNNDTTPSNDTDNDVVNAGVSVSAPYCDGSGAWFADVIVKGVRSPYALDFMSGHVSRRRAKQGKEWTLTDWMREQVLGLYRRDRAAAKKARLAEAKQRAEEEAAKAQKQRTKAERKAAARAVREAAERRTEEAAIRAAGGGATPALTCGTPPCTPEQWTRPFADVVKSVVSTLLMPVFCSAPSRSPPTEQTVRDADMKKVLAAHCAGDDVVDNAVDDADTIGSSEGSIDDNAASQPG